MCNFCKIRKYDPNNFMNNFNTCLCNSDLTAVEIGIACPDDNDSTNKIAIWGSGEDRTDYYYPKFCPECGRKL